MKWLLTHGVPRWVLYLFTALFLVFAVGIVFALFALFALWPAMLVMALWNDQSAATGVSVIWWMVCFGVIVMWDGAVEILDSHIPKRKPKEDEDAPPETKP